MMNRNSYHEDAPDARQDRAKESDDKLPPIFDERNGRLRRLSVAQGVRKLTLASGALNDICRDSIQRAFGTKRIMPSPGPDFSQTEHSTSWATPSQDTGRLLTFRGSVTTPLSRRASQQTPSSSSQGLSLMSIFAAKKMSRRFLAALSEHEGRDRRSGTFRKISTLSSASLSVRIRPPTYQLEPEYYFRPGLMQPRLDSLLKTRAQLLPRDYDATVAASFCTRLANEVKFLMHQSGADRFRYVVFCLVRQRAGQMCQLSSRMLWNMNTDRSISSEHLTSSTHVYCLVF
ncbi:membrane associated ring finger 18, partial [Clonorchis sinensis]